MNQDSFHIDEFIDTDVEGSVEPETQPQEIDVQKQVIEDLAAEKAMISEKLSNLMSDYLKIKKQLEDDERELNTKKAEVYSLKSEMEKAKSENNALSSQIAAMQNKEMDLQERNPNFLALLDRDVELPDRFPGETRDHVLEVIAEARDKAEAEGRLRRAQILESVLVVNEPNGTLAERRKNLQRLFSDNGNIVNGPVLEELARFEIPHKNGEQYLMPDEILKRTY